MLAKKFLLTKKDIGVFFRSPTRLCAGSAVRLRFRRSGHFIARWAFVVSSKVRKNAVARNTTRRRMAEIARHLQPIIARGFDLVFFASLQDKKALSTKKLRNDMIQTLQRCGAL